MADTNGHDPENDKALAPILGDPNTKMRVDKWLWYARVVKSRSLAQSLVRTGKIRVNNTKISAPSHNLSRDDVLTITLPRQIKILQLLAPGTRRGPATEAQQLYKDLTPKPEKKDMPVRPAKQAVREEGAGRPTKKERREISRFRSKAGEEY